MPHSNVLATRQQPPQNFTYPSDDLLQQGIEPPQSPSPSLEKMQRSAIDKLNSKPKEKSLFARLAERRRARKLKVEPEDNAVDYRNRWPTVTTLVTAPSDSGFFRDIDEEQSRCAKAKGLEMVARPLEWLADKLGNASEHIDRQIEVADAKAQTKASTPSSRHGSARPGKSTHPYDTVVADDHPLDKQNQVAVPATQRSRKSTGSQRSRPIGSPSRQPTSIKDYGSQPSYPSPNHPSPIEKDVDTELSSKQEKW